MEQMSAKHTPGPWEVFECTMGKHPWAYYIGHPMESKQVPDDEAAVNARLIAAAPELLEELKNAVTLLNAVGYVDGDIVDAARAVIAKAEDRP